MGERKCGVKVPLTGGVHFPLVIFHYPFFIFSKLQDFGSRAKTNGSKTVTNSLFRAASRNNFETPRLLHLERATKRLHRCFC